MLKKIHPVISLQLKPNFSSRGEAVNLSVSYTIPKAALAGRDPYLSYTTWYGNFGAHPYTESDIYATDDAGRLPFLFVDESSTRQQWRLGRDPVSDLTLRMEASPRKVDIRTPLGPRVDLRLDQGGLQGSGGWFLPQVTQGDVYLHTVEWDLSQAPPGTRGIWSHGEGPQTVEYLGPANTFERTIFMVGPVQSWPPEPQHCSKPGDAFSYWFGDLPPNLRRLRTFNTQLYGHTADFFRDTQGSYRVFIRTCPRSWGGSGFNSSFVFEYSPDIDRTPDIKITNLFTHEMIHSFIIMENEDNGDENGWFIEGIADFYAALLPYQFGLVPPSYVTDRINGLLLNYFTNPMINVPIGEAYKSFFDTWYAEWIPYTRGSAYFLLVADQLRRTQGGADSNSFKLFDQVIVDLAVRQRRGEKIQQKDWLAGINHFLQGSVDHVGQLRDMLEGKTVNLAGRRMGSTRNMLRETRQRILQFGFSKTSTSTRIVEGLIPGSRAEQAGLRNGDIIVETGSAADVAEDPTLEYYVVVNRNGRDVRIQYLPREDREVSCWLLESFKEDVIPANFISWP